MDRNAFRTSPDVITFTNWLADRHRSLSIGLDIKSSRFVPGGIRADLTGLDALLPRYRWSTQGSVTGDWRETQQCLRKLGDALKQAIECKSDDAHSQRAALSSPGAATAIPGPEPCLTCPYCIRKRRWWTTWMRRAGRSPWTARSSTRDGHRQQR